MAALNKVPSGLVISGLLVGGMATTIVFGLARGGFKAGRLRRTINVPVAGDRLEALVATAQQRLREIGFRQGSDPTRYIQDGAREGDLSTYTHSKIKKEFILSPDPAGAKSSVNFTLYYLDPIIGDTGESAYRDAVMAYVSGAADSMAVVPNRSYNAGLSLISSLFTWVVLGTLALCGYKHLVYPSLVTALVSVGTGNAALQAIKKRPGELTGRFEATVGISIALLGVAVFGALAFLRGDPVLK